jgi:hypothetical protein
MAVLVRFEVSATQRLYTSQYVPRHLSKSWDKNLEIFAVQTHKCAAISVVQSLK